MKSSKHSRLGARLGIYIVGLMLISFAIALSVKCNLGVSPVSSLPYVISQILPFSLGACTTVIYALYILAQMQSLFSTKTKVTTTTIKRACTLLSYSSGMTRLKA